MVRLLSIISIVLAIVLFPPAALALVSNNAVPGDATYPIKRTLEDIIYSVASVNPTTKALFSAARSDRRYKEFSALVSQGKFENNSLSELVIQTDIAVEEISQVTDNNQKQQLITQLSENIQKYDQGLAQLQEQAPSPPPTIKSTPTPSVVTTPVPQASERPFTIQTPVPTVKPTLKPTTQPSTQPTPTNNQPNNTAQQQALEAARKAFEASQKRLEEESRLSALRSQQFQPTPSPTSSATPMPTPLPTPTPKPTSSPPNSDTNNTSSGKKIRSNSEIIKSPGPVVEPSVAPTASPSPK